jgi:transcriptional regulator with XRE-family HTH domain
MLFADTDQAAKATRDPVAPAKRSATASAKAASKSLDDEQPAHSFATLMVQMATLVRNTCRTPSAGADAPTFEVGKLIGTSGAIIGRYERGEMTPSIEVAKKLAEAFGVTVDYLVSPEGQANVVQDSAMLDRIRAINELSSDEREKLLYVVDGLLRDARARRTYAAA